MEIDRSGLLYREHFIMGIGLEATSPFEAG
jgi:hypothetical protein